MVREKLKNTLKGKCFLFLRNVKVLLSLSKPIFYQNIFFLEKTKEIKEKIKRKLKIEKNLITMSFFNSSDSKWRR
jgi:hypothetical protein